MEKQWKDMSAAEKRAANDGPSGTGWSHALERGDWKDCFAVKLTEN